MIESLLITCLPWIIKTFPSFGDFLSVLLPICGTVITLLGVFTNLLPVPGSSYAVPNVDAIKAELDHRGALIVKMVIWAKNLVTFVNLFLNSKLYKTIHHLLTVISNIKTAAFSTMLKSKTK